MIEFSSPYQPVWYG